MLDWFLSGLPTDANSPFDRRRVLVMGAFASAAVSGALTLARLVLIPGFDQRHLVILVASIGLAITPFVMKWSGSYRLAGHFLVAVLTVSVALDMHHFGGLGAPATYAVFVTPLMATFYLGVRAGTAWTVVQLASLIVASGHSGAQDFPPLDPALIDRTTSWRRWESRPSPSSSRWCTRRSVPVPRPGSRPCCTTWPTASSSSTRPAASRR